MSNPIIVVDKSKNPKKHVKEYYALAAEKTGLTVHEISKLNNFRFSTTYLLIKALYKQRIHFRNFMNITFNKKQVELMEKKGILEEQFPDIREKLTTK